MLELWRQSEVLWKVDFDCDADIVQRSPNRPREFPFMYGSDEVFLLRPVTVKDSHPVRYLSEAQMAESALLLAARDLHLHRPTWMTYIDYIGIYIGNPSGRFHDPTLRSMFMSCLEGHERAVLPLLHNQLVDG
jgi:hypothetical protein